MHHYDSIWADPRTWVGVAFLIFFLIFGRKAGLAINSILDRRAAAIRSELDEASRLRREAEIMLQQATVRRDEASREADALLQQARAEAARMADAARAEAATSAARRERMAMDRIGAAEKAAVTEVRLAAADIAARAAGQVIAETHTSDADASLIDRAIAGLPAALSGRQAA